MKNDDKKEEYLHILKEAICRDIKIKEIPLLILKNIKTFIDTIDYEYKDLFEIDVITKENAEIYYLVNSRKKSYINWPEYKILERNINLYIKPKKERENYNKIRWRTALLHFFCEYTKTIRQRYLKWQEDKRKEKKEWNKLNHERELKRGQERRLHLFKLRTDSKYREEIEKQEALRKQEHERKMREDPVYYREQMTNLVKNYNLLRIMSGMGGIPYVN